MQYYGILSRFQVEFISAIDDIHLPVPIRQQPVQAVSVQAGFALHPQEGILHLPVFIVKYSDRSFMTDAQSSVAIVMAALPLEDGRVGFDWFPFPSPRPIQVQETPGTGHLLQPIHADSVVDGR